MVGSMVRISPSEVAVADLAASRIIHNVKDGFPKGDWYMKLAPFSQGFSKSTILNGKSRSKQRSVLPLPRSNEMRWSAPLTY
jgi:hypothetical protein